MTEVAAPGQPIAGADAAKALPANQWLYRRIFIYAVTIVLLYFRWTAEQRMPAEDLAAASVWDIAVVAFLAFIYVAGATAEHFVRLGSIVQAINPFARKPA